MLSVLTLCPVSSGVDKRLVICFGNNISKKCGKNQGQSLFHAIAQNIGFDLKEQCFHAARYWSLLWKGKGPAPESVHCGILVEGNTRDW